MTITITTGDEKKEDDFFTTLGRAILTGAGAATTIAAITNDTPTVTSGVRNVPPPSAGEQTLINQVFGTIGQGVPSSTPLPVNTPEAALSRGLNRQFGLQAGILPEIPTSGPLSPQQRASIISQIQGQGLGFGAGGGVPGISGGAGLGIGGQQGAFNIDPGGTNIDPGQAQLPKAPSGGSNVGPILAGIAGASLPVLAKLWNDGSLNSAIKWLGLPDSFLKTAGKAASTGVEAASVIKQGAQAAINFDNTSLGAAISAGEAASNIAGSTDADLVDLFDSFEAEGLGGVFSPGGERLDAASDLPSGLGGDLSSTLNTVGGLASIAGAFVPGKPGAGLSLAGSALTAPAAFGNLGATLGVAGAELGGALSVVSSALNAASAGLGTAMAGLLAPLGPIGAFVGITMAMRTLFGKENVPTSFSTDVGSLAVGPNSTVQDLLDSMENLGPSNLSTDSRKDIFNIFAQSRSEFLKPITGAIQNMSPDQQAAFLADPQAFSKQNFPGEFFGLNQLMNEASDRTNDAAGFKMTRFVKEFQPGQKPLPFTTATTAPLSAAQPGLIADRTEALAAGPATGTAGFSNADVTALGGGLGSQLRFQRQGLDLGTLKQFQGLVDQNALETGREPARLFPNVGGAISQNVTPHTPGLQNALLKALNVNDFNRSQFEDEQGNILPVGDLARRLQGPARDEGMSVNEFFRSKQLGGSPFASDTLSFALREALERSGGGLGDDEGDDDDDD